ncbi:glycosyltransferase [Brevundimonas sp.]|uniref:glycosyltransferase n=5 Tax=Brevundimonas sp. TaxID=1871086 RepID=UPI00391F3999
MTSLRADLDKLRARADAARDRRDWAEAALAYGQFAARAPGDAGMRVQLGHALKESGDVRAAEGAYRAALAIDPDNPDTWLQLGHALKLLDRRADALDAYAEALARDPDFGPARQELVAAGRRDRLPEVAYGPGAADRIARRVADLEAQLAAARADLATVCAYPPARWHALRRDNPLPAPPASPPGPPLQVVVDARPLPPAGVRLILESLQAQVGTDWRLTLLPAPSLLDHAVSLALRDEPRARIVSRPEDLGGDGPVVVVRGGGQLAPHALAWLALAADRSGAAFVHTDHDHVTGDWREGALHREPCLYASPDPLDLATAPPPPLVWVRDGTRAAALSADPAASLVPAAANGRLAHLPLCLFSLAFPATDPARSFEPEPDPPADLPLCVIIPTRDAADLLERCISSLTRLAAAPERLSFIILDNRSCEPATAALLERLRGRPSVQVLEHDEPFNWSRMNNLAAEETAAPLLVFANNDVEMRTAGWDARLRRRLAEPRTGLVGARLLYPDGHVQHAGIVLGPGDGRPVHEGLGAPGDAPGPLGRWVRPRRAAAVTGAFMAARRDLFVTLGGFDAARLAIAYNDVDLCLKVRAAGFEVLYDAGLELTHYESRTRGHNVTLDRVAWDDAELAALHAARGEALLHDPTVNPHWTSFGRLPFEGLRQPDAQDALAWLDRQVTTRPAAGRSSPPSG